MSDENKPKVDPTATDTNTNAQQPPKPKKPKLSLDIDEVDTSEVLERKISPN